MSSSRADHWSSEKYKNAAGFVPQLTTRVVQYLDPQADDTILDIGCGDAQLTSVIAQHVNGSGKILGLDASPSFIETAKSTNKAANCQYELQDCTKLGENVAIDGRWNKVFSNAAMHWILRNESTRTSFFQDVNKALMPGGKFIFEMGGKGNVAEVHAALTAALTTVGGLSIKQAREASPWFFPSTDWMASTLSQAGFAVEVCELEYRPTKFTAETADGSGGVEGWVRLMGARFLEAVEAGKRDEVVRRVCEWIDGVIHREEDGSKWVGYVRLRGVARKL